MNANAAHRGSRSRDLRAGAAGASGGAFAGRSGWPGGVVATRPSDAPSPLVLGLVDLISRFLVRLVRDTRAAGLLGLGLGVGLRFGQGLLRAHRAAQGLLHGRPQRLGDLRVVDAEVVTRAALGVNNRFDPWLERGVLRQQLLLRGLRRRDVVGERVRGLDEALRRRHALDDLAGDVVTGVILLDRRGDELAAGGRLRDPAVLAGDLDDAGRELG